MAKIINFNQTYLIAANNAFPSGRITSRELTRRQGWLNNPARSLAIKSKTQPAIDEDSLTLAWQAAWPIVRGWENKIQALYLGSESPIYAVKPEVTLLINFLGLEPEMFGADIEFACRAGLDAAIIVAQFIEAGSVEVGLAIGSDTAQAKPGDILSVSASAAASAWLIGNQVQAGSLKFIAAASYISDTPDFWRYQINPYPGHGGRFTGRPAYFHHLESVYYQLKESVGFEAGDFAKIAIHAPNIKFPQRLAKKLGFKSNQIRPLLADQYGNPYTASVMTQTTIKSTQIRPGQKILILSFGSGAGAIGLIMEKVKGSGAGL